MNRFKASKFRHTEARLPRREAWIGGIRAGSGASCGNHVKASCRWVAFNAEAAGVLGIVPLECKDGGKRTVSQLCCHSDAVTDFDFSPFDQLLLATGSADEMVKVWRLPESGQDMPSGAGLTLGPGGGPVDVLQFHPTADGVLASGAGKQVTVWDVGQQQPLTALDSHGDQLQSLAWKRDGHLLGTSCKDKKLRIFDPRASPAASQSVMGHENNKDSRLLWMGSSDCLISVGFSQMREREVKLWDSRRFSGAMLTVALDTSPGAAIPLYDSDTGLLVLAGREKTSCTASRWHPRSQRSPRVSRMCPTPGSRQPRGPRPCLRLPALPAPRPPCPSPSDPVPDGGQHPGPGRRATPGPGRHGLRGDSASCSSPTPPSSPSATWCHASPSRTSTRICSLTVPGCCQPPAPRPGGQGQPAGQPSPPPSFPAPGCREPTPTPAPPTPTGARAVATPHHPRWPRRAALPPPSRPAPAPPVALPAAPARSRCRAFWGPSSRFRHAQGRVLHRDTHLTNLRGLSLTTPGECDGFCANHQRVALPLLSAGGQIAVLELSKPGRLPDAAVPTIQNGSAVVDLSWDPFDPRHLAVAGEDAKIRLWRIPEGGLRETLQEPEAVLRGHTEKIYSIRFHPMASDLLVSSSYDMTVRIWELSAGQEALCLRGTHRSDLQPGLEP
ncbi:unnamed protein product [Bubo scandiacus]